MRIVLATRTITRAAAAAVSMIFALTIAPALGQAQSDGSLASMFRSSAGGAAPAATYPQARSRAVRSTEARPARHRSRGVQVASLGGRHHAPEAPRRAIGGGGRVNWVASSGCLNGSLQGVVSHVAANYGAVTVSSTCRSRAHNARVGGATKSHHMTGDAVDFRVHGNVSGAVAYLSGRSGGFKHYGGGLFHVDTGPTRRF
jgi:hypothetical protein